MTGRNDFHKEKIMDVVTFMTEIIPIKDKRLKAILAKECRIETYKRGDRLNELGEPDQSIRFVISGIVRGYFPGEKGKETTSGFAFRPGESIAGTRLLDGSANEMGWEVVEDCELFCIPVETIFRLRPEFLEMCDLHAGELAKAALHHMDSRKMLCLKTAKERYEWFLVHYPGIIDRVSHKDVASFLNITPVTLSRVRNGKE
jgi:CRP-like cAMP-binding protein